MRKEALFADLTSLCDFFQDVRNREECMWKAKYERVKLLEKECYILFSDLMEYNAKISDTKEEISLRDKGRFIDLVDVIRSAYLKFEAADQQSAMQNTGKPSLHKVQLPFFDGSVEKWMDFKALYDSLVHNNNSLTAEQKFHYLKTNLKREAASVISSYVLDGTNYQLAYDALVNRYHSPRRLLNYYLQLILKYKTESIINPQKFLNVHEAAISALKNLDVADLADFILFQLSYNNLDQSTRQALDLSLGDINGVPETSNLLEFVKLISKSDELKRDTQSNASGHFAKVIPKNGRTKNSLKIRCTYCGGEHFLAYCESFKEKPLPQKIEFISKRKLCTNCLGSHPLNECWSPKTCRLCKGKHHSWLHTNPPSNNKISPESSTPFSISANHLRQHNKSLLLSTAIILIKTEGGYHRVRALIDTGSEASFISEAVVQRFKLQRRASTTYVNGVGDSFPTKTRGRVLLEFKSIYNSDTHVTSALILKKLTEYVPPRLQTNQLPLANLNWADDLESTDPIEIILGAEIYPKLILEGIWKSPDGTLLAQFTTLGWILSGILDDCSKNSRKYLHCCSLDKTLLKAVERFWKLEEPTPQSNQEDNKVENYYRATTRRTPEGRFVVRLPFKEDPSSLGESLSAAKRSNYFLQNRLRKSPELSKLYHEFMKEYHHLNHMERVSSTDVPPHHYFLPHHTVLRPSSITTKLRVVFNASKPTNSGMSLNDILYVGPQLLPNIQDIILRWRRHKIVFSTDIEKMFRQILVHESDRNFQLILFREDQNQQIFRLNTITYGTACAPFLAIRTLHQLANEESELQLAAEIIKRETYMDDILSGADDIPGAMRKQQELIELLRRGGFPLQKWTSNTPELTAHLLPNSKAKTEEQNWFPSEMHSMLGLKWIAQSDQLIIHSNLEPVTATVTKRVVLSAVAKLFDPLGYAAPALVQAKTFLQSLWLTKLSWDDVLPEEQAIQWSKLQGELAAIHLHIPRWLGLTSKSTGIEFFGFADASEQAMAAVVYIATPTPEGKKVCLLGAKTKLAPIKQISLPRLELNAALLLVRLAKKLITSLELDQNTPQHLWSDSTTALCWIASHPSKWQTYIANRVSEIQTSLPEAVWRYVPSAQNPADCATRGLSSTQLMQYELWWEGPSWMKQERKFWPNQPNSIQSEAPEQKKPTYKIACHMSKFNFIDEFINRFSCFLRMLRTTAYCLRPLRKIQTKPFQPGPLTAEELQKAKFCLIKRVQEQEFAKEWKLLKSGKFLSNDSALIKLNPIFDDSGILRVGGRLKHSLLDPEEKHPIILPHKHNFSTLVVREAHKKTLHGGVQLTLATLRREWWILKGRQAVKSIIHSCVVCRRFQASTLYQQMADLPKERVVPARPFLHSGVDYAGPIQLRTSKGRGYKSYKGYIAVFVCFFSRAVHLEAVTDYTAEGFLAAYRRFTSRRGLCATLTSDRGTNFVGAAAEMKILFEQQSGTQIAEYLANEGTVWRFNPPGAPHFGGLWEAAVKAVKHHLKRVLGDSTLTFEEMTTLLCQVEGILNSRPLQPLSDDPSDPAALTPAHFLIGSSLRSVPDHTDDHSTAKSIRSRFQLIQAQKQAFWKNWSQEYIQQLQSRPKWRNPTNPVAEGDLVLIKNELTSPSRWPLARVLELHQGSDGLIRVVTLKTATSTVVRPLTKLVPIIDSKNE